MRQGLRHSGDPPDKKIIEVAINEMTAITGQKAVATISRKDIANFKLRKKMPIGVMVTLRRASDGIAFTFYLIYKVCHFFCFFRVRTTYTVGFYQVEIIVRVSTLQFDRTYLRGIGSDVDSQLAECQLSQCAGYHARNRFALSSAA